MAVKRAARFGLPYFPAHPSPELEALYLSELARLGNAGFIERHDDLSLLIIDPHPDSAWEQLGPCLLRETGEYARWTRAGVARRYESAADSVASLRAQKVYEIITPEACLARAAERSEYRPILHPLAGGVPVERAWRTLRLFVERVLGPSKAS